ncbi:hypothetical protein C5B90_19295 [Haloferax sp. Atlit-12N]|uniref:hypothetical protein n=1 Tax=unclassified Haloferax TaxID=2625095 RepID=UPI000E21FCBD|nr:MULTISPECIES: hypothetical protein [unclassified Haloferax]RDZ61418.1 hypothetical protein C5B90_19295 [Haloferax sp. Atlit-12N]REA00230.1 hypothetical protein DEQ92_20480 [Haloferax sp. Atlit-6N]
MPTEWQSANLEERPCFPDLKADIGEDPARFLAEPLEPDAGDGASGMLALARIRGLETITKVRAFRAVERALHDGERQAIKDALDKRERELSNEVQ